MPPPQYTLKPVRQMIGKRGLLIFIYGPPGVGKTTAAAEAARSKLITSAALIDVEAGVTSVTHLDKVNVYDPPPRTWANIQSITKWYRDTPKDQIDENLVIWDNGSEISKMALDSVVRDPNQKGGAHSAPEIQHWGRATNEYEIWIRMLRDIAGDKDITMIVTAWDRRRGGEPGAPDTESAPLLPKDVLSFNTRLAEELPGIVDMVGYMTVRRDGSRHLTFEASPAHSAKFRRNKLENARLIPSTIIFGEEQSPIADIIDTIKGGQPWPKMRYPKSQSPAPPAAPSAANKEENK